MRALAIVAALLTACATPVPDKAPPEPVRWRSGAYPIELRASDALSECQAASLAAAVVWLEARTGRDLFTPITVPSTDVAVSGVAVEGVIAVAPALALSTPYTAGETRRPVYAGTRLIHSATVEVVGCSPWVVAHELGHAIGLDHTGDASSLMFPVALGGWALSAHEIDQINQS